MGTEIPDELLVKRHVVEEDIRVPKSRIEFGFEGNNTGYGSFEIAIASQHHESCIGTPRRTCGNSSGVRGSVCIDRPGVFRWRSSVSRERVYDLDMRSAFPL
jgi:hypothetical protein